MNSYLSSYPEITWPALPGPRALGIMALLFQLEQTQWWTAAQLAEQQFAQLDSVVKHAYRTVPYYRQAFDAAGIDLATVASPAHWQNVPLLSRRDIQLAGEALLSPAVPESHGRVSQHATSGSTNQPVVTASTGITELFWRVFTLRDHFWHRRDFRRRFCAIRHTGDDSALPPDGLTGDGWGQSTSGVVATGPAYVLNVRSTIEQQLDWLLRRDPAYILAYPSALRGIAQLVTDRGLRFSNLLELRTFGEIVEPECRTALQAAFGVPVVDMYSSQEVGYIALQCPEHEHYHVMAENLYVEVLDDQNQPCRPGEVGRIVVSTLHNFAMPLLRYDIGDFAEVGAPCDCGRGLPVLKRVLGRQRNLLTLPGGRQVWPVFDVGERPRELPAFFQFQVIQRSLGQIDVHVVRHQDFTAAERTRVQTYFQQTLGHPFEINLVRVPSIPRSRAGKFEDFISELAYGA